jgi:hypothetical protein
VLAAAKPFINVAKEALFKNTIIVVDASSSMNAPFERGTRFEEAVRIAKDNLGSINTLIIAKKTPEAVLMEESAGKVKDYLNKLKPTDNPTDLYGAITLAGSYAKQEARIAVISDFIDTETDTDLNTVKKTIEAQGIKVDFIKVFSKINNIGIVDLSITDAKTTAVIRNYNDEEAQVKLKINNVEESLKIPADSKELFSFTTPPGTSKLEMTVEKGEDGFKQDNVAFISAPSDAKKRILYITNNNAYAKNYLHNALSVMKNTVIDVAIPPKIPNLENYDIFILKDINPGLILPGTFKGIKKETEEKGKAAVIMAQPGMLGIDYQGLVPLVLKDEIKATSNILPGTSESITSNIDFGITKRYFSANASENKIIVIAAAEDGSPLITFSNLGNGKVLYYGLLDEDREADVFFGKSPSYFVFWKRALDFVTNTPSVKNLNFKTGNYISFPEEQNIQTPGGRITTKNLALDNIGLYTLKDRIIAINLVNEKESDISNEQSLSSQGIAQSSDRFKEKIPYELTDYLLVAALILLLLELAYVKGRGDF